MKTETLNANELQATLKSKHFTSGGPAVFPFLKTEKKEEITYPYIKILISLGKIRKKDLESNLRGTINILD